MDGTNIKTVFNHLKRMHEELKANTEQLDSFEMKVLKRQNIDVTSMLDEVAKLRADYASMATENKENLIWIYKQAIMRDVDVDGSRLLRVYRFLCRNAQQINEHLRQLDLPKENQSLWGIIALTAIILIYAKI